MKKRIIAAGHICLDITPIFPSKNTKQLGDILTPGKLVNVEHADVHLGGSVANTGLAMQFFGAEVSLMGKIGKDPFGEIICNELKVHDAEEGMIISEEETTSYSIVLAVPGTDRIFLHNPGANHTFCAKDIPQKELHEAALFHFGYPPLMKSMYQKDGAELVKIMKQAKECNTATSLDFAAIEPDSEAGRINWKKILQQVIPYVDILAPSVEELCFMLDQERYFEWQKRAAGRDITEILDIENDVRPLAEQCMQLGAKILLIKCGAPGLYFQTADQKTLKKVGEKLELDVSLWSDLCGFKKSYVPERVLSATGAGDTSIAAFLTAMLKGYSPEMTIHLTAAAGASCVTAYDALSGLKSFAELEQKVET